MKLAFKTLRGRPQKIRIDRFLINWRGKSASNFQTQVKRALFPLWRDHIVCEEFPTSEGLRIDFLNITTGIAIEANGAQHTQHVKHFHPEEKDFTEALIRDIVKRKWCEANNITLIDINYDDPVSTEWLKEIIESYAD